MGKELTGQTFGRLTITATAPAITESGTRRVAAWQARCSCGKEVVVRQYCLFRKAWPSRSCGCLGKEEMKKAKTIHGAARPQEVTPEWQAWRQMRRRCYEPTCDSYSTHGGRGVRVCDRWRDSFANFLADMGAKPSPKHSLDRIDNEGNYEPGNCRWATAKEQCRNRRNNTIIECHGMSKCLSEWAEYSGVSYPALLHRLKRMTLAEALAKPYLARGDRRDKAVRKTDACA